MPTSPPRVLTIAGSDPSGGAGIQADLKTFAAFGCYGMAALTALTAQNTVGVRAVHVPPASFVAEQVRAVFDDCAPRAVKTGMLFSTEIVAAVCGALGPGALVVDPVMVATSGDRLLEPSAEAAIVERLLPRATVVTPNAAEAEVLSGEDVSDDEGALRAARRILELGAHAVLVKGGHRDAAATTARVSCGPVTARIPGNRSRISASRTPRHPVTMTLPLLSSAASIASKESATALSMKPHVLTTTTSACSCAATVS